MYQAVIELIPAECLEQVASIVRKTIQTVYPRYYPSGAVQFFLDLHCDGRIEKAVDTEEIYLAVSQGNVVGTGKRFMWTLRFRRRGCI